MSNSLRHLKRDTNRWSLLTVAIGLFVSIPLITIGFYLFWGTGEMWGHIVDHFLMTYIKNSIFLLVGTGILTFVFGVSTAWIVANYQFRWKRYIQWLLFLPLTIPSYIMAYAYVGLFDYGGTLIRIMQYIGFPIQKMDIMNSYGLIWVLSCSLFPYVYASSFAMFKSIPSSVKESSELLGANRWKYFSTVALPLACPAIIGGLFLVFMEVLNDYGAAKYFGVQTFTTGIFRSWTMLEDLQSAIYLSAILVVLVFIINNLVRWHRNKRYYDVNNESDTRSLHSQNSKEIPAWYWVVLIIPILFGFVLPVGQLLYWAILTFEDMVNMELIYIALQSVFTAVLATISILMAALMLIYFTRWNHLKGLAIFKKMSTIGYVIPGAIIGIGIIRSSQSIIDFFERSFGLEIGYLFFGSSFVLIYAYVFRFLAVAYNPIEANTLKIGKQLSEASYILKAGKYKTLWKVELPLLRTAIVSAFFLVVIDIMKELPLTLILKPYKLQTLAVKAYEYADDERVAEASWPALILIALIIFLMFVLNNVERYFHEPDDKAKELP